MTAVEPVLLPAEAAPLLGVSERTLRRMKLERVIRWVQLRPRIWGMRASDIAAYHAARTQGGDGDGRVAPQEHKRARGRRPAGGSVVLFSVADARR